MRHIGFRLKVSGLCMAAAATLLATPPEDLGSEAVRRHTELMQSGYNLTYGLRLKGGPGRNPTRVDFLVPESESEHRFSLWIELQGGEGSAKVLDGNGRTVFAWAGRRLDLTFSRRLPPGKGVLEIDVLEAQGGRAEFGVKGPLMELCKPDPTRCQEVAASPADGFHWPYLLLVPKRMRHPVLLVAPNNTGFATESLDLLRASALCGVERQTALAERLGCPLLVPMFPRPSAPGEEGNLYLHALSRASLMVEHEPWRRVDLQLLAMVKHARTHSSIRDFRIEPRVLLWGFSASGSFVNRFTLLHPQAVLAVACGSPGGWPTVPAGSFEGQRLDYPIGIADLAALNGRATDEAALKQVQWFFFLGEEDVNDAVPFRDSFSKEAEDLVMGRFGRTLTARWEVARNLFARKGLAARFKRYPGVAHEVTAEIQEDIAHFFEARLGVARGARVP